MSYAEHGSRIFLAGRPGNGVYSICGDYAAPQKRSEGRLKMYESCTDIRAWSPNVLESSRYFRELNEHTAIAPGKIVPFDVVMENMMGLTAQAQKELRVTQRELQKYKSLKLSPEQRKHLEVFDKANIEQDVQAEDEEETRVGLTLKPFLSRETLLFHSSSLACSRHPDMYLSMYLRPDQRFRYDREICNSLLASIHVSKENRFTSSSSENETYLVSRVTSCDLLNEQKPTRECSNQASVCIEYVDASSQAVQDMCEVCVQTDECKDPDIGIDDGYDDGKQVRDDLDSCSSQYYGSSESASTSECGLRLAAGRETCEKSHKRIIIQKDSEIIVLKNELSMKEDELEELNRRLEETNEDAQILRHDFNILQRNLQIVSDRRRNEVDELNSKLSASECVVDRLKAEFGRICQVCHLKSQEIQQLGLQLKDAELLSMENESLARKVKEIEYLTKEAESYGITLDQLMDIWRERDMLQEKYREQKRTLADQEGEIQELLTLIKQMSVKANTQEVEINEMNDVVADLKNEIRTKDDKISRFEVQLDCMERKVGSLTSMLKNSLDNFDESKVAYESIYEHARCEHDTCLDVQSTLAALGTFIATLEESKREKRDRLQEIDNLRACVRCYSRETVSEIVNTDFYAGHETVQLQTAEDVSTSSDRDDCLSSKELVNVQIQSDDVETSTCSDTCSRLNQVISNEEIDRALTTHIKRYINKMSAILQGAGDHHVQIVREHVKQRQELQKKDLEITELRQKVAQHILRRGEGDCMMHEQLRKRMLEKEKLLEAVIGERDTEMARLRECLDTLEQRVCVYSEERDALRNENADLTDARSTLAKENEACREELRALSDQMRERIQEIDDLKHTIDALQKGANDTEDLRKRLMDLQMRNNDLTSKLTQTNETIRENIAIIVDLKSQDEKNKLTLAHRDIEYDTMMTQKLHEIEKLKDDNQSLCKQLNDTEIKLAHSNNTISLLRSEDNSLAAISALRTSLTSLDQDKEKLLERVDNLRSEIANCEGSSMRFANELFVLLRQNEALRTDLETVRGTNDQLLRTRENNAVKQPLKDAPYTLPGRIYEKITRLREEDDGEERDNDADGSIKAAECRSSDIMPGTDDRRKEQSPKVRVDKNAEFDTSQRTRDELDSAAHETPGNYEQAAYKLRLLETQYRERLRQIEKLSNDLQLKDLEIKNLQECVTLLLREKNDLQNKIQRQVEEYQNKLALLKRKYDSSLSAFRERHNENVERLQARFQDIMKIERSEFDAESWLQSLNLKELAELNNRIDILSSRTAANGESDMPRTHAEAPSHHAHQNNKPTERKFQNKFTLRKERAREHRIITSFGGGENKRGSAVKICDSVSNGKVVLKELYSRDSKHKRERRLLDDTEKKPPLGSHAESLEPKTDKILDWQRVKFIYGSSVHHRLTNGC